MELVQSLLLSPKMVQIIHLFIISTTRHDTKDFPEHLTSRLMRRQNREYPSDILVTMCTD
jgi:hypothetical protein